MADNCNDITLSNSAENTFLEAVLETVDALILMFDQQGIIVRFNRACEKLSGYSANEAIGQSIWELLLQGVERAAMQAHFDTFRADKFPRSYQNRWFTRNGDEHLIEWTSTALLDPSSKNEYVVATGIDVTELQRVKENAEMYERIVSASNGHLSFVDSNYIYRAVNNAYLDAHDLESAQIIGMHVADLLGEHIFKEIKPRIDRSLAGETISYQAWFDFKGQGRRLMDVSYAPAKDNEGCIIGIVVNSRDISYQDEAESERHLAAKVFQNAGDAILITDNKGMIIEVNPAFTTITGYSRDEVLGKNPNISKSGRHTPAFYEEMWSTLLNNGRWEGEVWDRRKNGEVYPKWLKITAVTDATTGQINHYVGLFSDISERKAVVDKLEHLAHHDPLSGLPNRTLFYDRLSQSIVQARRDKRRVAVMFIDLDHFKEINDEYGHDIGDLLLCGAAERLSSCVRESDTIARMGGDEFTAILTDVTDSSAATAVADKMILALQLPIPIGSIDITISCSIGISIFPDCCVTPESLLNCADKGLYDAKERGRNCYTIYTDAEDFDSE